MDGESTQTRERWLLRGVEALRPVFAAHAITLPAVRVSTGWPGGKGTKRTTLAQCWGTASVSDGVAAIFISPVLAEPVAILAALAHELCHAADDCKSGHKRGFITLTRAIGLVKPWTATQPNEDLKATLVEIAAELGEYNHGTITNVGRVTQTTRMLKVECVDCGCVLRMTAKWLTEAGVPTCGCGGGMSLA